MTKALFNNKKERSEIEHNKKRNMKELFFNAVFVVAWFACLFVGPFPQLSQLIALVIIGCILVSFFDDNFYLYLALFMYMRYKVLLGDTPVYRLYSYLMVIKFLMELPKLKIRVGYLPAILVFALHSVFATGGINMRLGLNVIVDVLIIYIVLIKVISNDKLMRKFLIAFMMGAITSGIYGWTAEDSYVDINVRGAGNTEVNRNFGSLSDVNYASLFYNMSILTAIFIKGIKPLLKVGLAGLFFVFLLQTASLSGLITLFVLGILAIILKFRIKSIMILIAVGIVGVLVISMLLEIPAFREIQVINGLLIRIAEKLRYIVVGRWDMLTTDRFNLWGSAIDLFKHKNLWGQLFGGSVITVMIIDTTLLASGWACHQSYLQALLNFGILGTVIVFGVLFVVLGYRIVRHFLQKKDYENEDIRILQILFNLGFLIFGISVDFFLDWTYLFFYFI